jgi:hypothetical protein
VVLLLAIAGVVHVAAPACDLHALSRFVAKKQAADMAIVNSANYHRQYLFF